jgi:hypothetical protein
MHDDKHDDGTDDTLFDRMMHFAVQAAMGHKPDLPFAVLTEVGALLARAFPPRTLRAAMLGATAGVVVLRLAELAARLSGLGGQVDEDDDVHNGTQYRDALAHVLITNPAMCLCPRCLHDARAQETLARAASAYHGTQYAEGTV